MADFIVTKVIHEVTGINLSEQGDRTFGELLDETLKRAIEDGTQVQSITFELSDEDWNLIRRDRPSPTDGGEPTQPTPFRRPKKGL